MIGTVLNIQRFCTDDGPGIRTTVFLKGCPLRCIWCHNPESQAQKPEILYDAKKCIGCRRCSAVCPQKCHLFEEQHTFVRSACIGCGACADVCDGNALKLQGEMLSVDEVYNEVKKDRTFYESSEGGVTVSGGEPLFQAGFTAELLRICKENGIRTAIETSGFAAEDVLLSVIKYCDLVLFDIKETDDTLHRRYTGVSLEPILRNLHTVNEKKIPFIIRAPIIPTLNDRESHFRSLKAMRESLKYCQGIEIMPYHRLGSYKYELLGREYRCSDIQEPTKETVTSWRKLL